ncbi:LOW QUALITY PROTEIN: hypothetical protein BDA96_01G448100 [Sorghum bicolor]|uniref:Uncharacterized protein n=1 Tax=Sorghum bicolor TaxID=4558 RepID=A0A921S4V7_SORBI|nr:LOW QUALITY PROTEIN: hypothetical protein BDA96_01G448100 [Sorghum bicolor]
MARRVTFLRRLPRALPRFGAGATAKTRRGIPVRALDESRVGGEQRTNEQTNSAGAGEGEAESWGGRIGDRRSARQGGFRCDSLAGLGELGVWQGTASARAKFQASKQSNPQPPPLPT